MTASTYVPDDLTDVKVGDTVVATFRPQWENRGGNNYTVTDVIWRQRRAAKDDLMIGPNRLAGAVHVDIVERAS